MDQSVYVFRFISAYKKKNITRYLANFLNYFETNAVNL